MAIQEGFLNEALSGNTVLLRSRKRAPVLSGGRTIMDRVSESLLNEFSKEHDLLALPQETQFEHFAGYITVQRHFTESFDSSDIVTQGDSGIDAISIIVNGS